jgi:predicted dithiol-disulfide oxidoreductase (DUF899 family)
MQPHKVVSHDEWIAARKAYLIEEKAFTKARDALSKKRRELPWEKLEKNYVFDTPAGKQTLGDLFGGKSQLIVYHEERPGLSVFYKNDAGEIFHTYSSYGRGLDILIGAYNFLDFAPKGRDEDSLAFSMAWVRHHDRYDGAPLDTKATYQEPKSASCCD